MSNLWKVTPFAAVAGASLLLAGLSSAAYASDVVHARTSDKAMALDGDIGDWAGVDGTTVPLTGKGKVDAVEIKAVIHGDTIYVLASWADSSEDRLHKPYEWNEASKSYKGGKQREDRLAISFAMSGDFSANKMDGSNFTADVWHWKASRSDPAGVAQDKMWTVSSEPFEKGKTFKTKSDKPVYLARSSDSGDRLYKPVKYDVKQDQVMPRYAVNMNPTGSIADVKAKSVWRDGRWYLELSRKLDTGHADDAVIPANGKIKIAIAAFNGVSGKRHSVSETLTLVTGNAAM